FVAEPSRKGGVPPEPVTFPAKPSRPGRLVAATACPGRHETPGTNLGRPERTAGAAANPAARRPLGRRGLDAALRGFGDRSLDAVDVADRAGVGGGRHRGVGA